jgi:hypothetical protein
MITDQILNKLALTKANLLRDKDKNVISNNTFIELYSEIEDKHNKRIQFLLKYPDKAVK